MARERARVRVSVPETRCPYCHDGIPRGEEPIACPACHAQHHAACLREHGSCATCGADHPRFKSRRGAPASESSRSTAQALAQQPLEDGPWEEPTREPPPEERESFFVNDPDVVGSIGPPLLRVCTFLALLMPLAYVAGRSTSLTSVGNDAALLSGMVAAAIGLAWTTNRVLVRTQRPAALRLWGTYGMAVGLAIYGAPIVAESLRSVGGGLLGAAGAGIAIMGMLAIWLGGERPAPPEATSEDLP